VPLSADTTKVMRLREGAWLLLFGVTYYVAFQVGMAFYFAPENVATVWPANGLVVGALLLTRTRRWPVILLVQAAIQLVLDLYQLGNPAAFGLLSTLSNTMAALVIASVVRWLSKTSGLDRLVNVVTLVTITVIGEGIGAFSGALAVILTYPDAAFWSAWKVWWFADVIGVLLVAPVVLGWGQGLGPRSGWRWSRQLEGGLMLATTIVISHLIFSTSSSHSSWFFGSLYLVFPFLLWSALRFRPAISASTMLMVGFILVYHADHGRGPFVLAGHSTHELVLSVQAFMTFGCLTTMVVTAILAERRQAEVNLRASEVQFRTLIEHAADAIFVHDLEGRFVAVNQRAVQHLGYSRYELLAMSMLDIETGLASETPEKLHQLWADLQPGHPVTIEGRHRRKDGSSFPVEVRIGLTESEPRPLIIALARDITERRQQEAERLEMERWFAQSQKMEAIGTLAGGIAHDFNNLLGVIMGYCEMAEDELDPAGTTRTYLTEMMTAARRASDLVHQILTFSRPAQSDQQLVKPDMLVLETVRLLAASIPKTIEVRHAADPDSGVIRAAPEQVHQIVMNLCTNAYQAMRESGGILDVRLQPMVVDEKLAAEIPDLQCGEHVCLTVRDTGPGMPDEVAARVFEPFFTTKPVGEGSGMGLAVVHGIVRALNGTITVKTTPGQGTEFMVLLPCAGDAAVTTRTAPSRPEAGSERILFVDDEPQLVRLARTQLQSLGYRVDAYTSAREALDSYREDPASFDLVITDQTMPEMTGVELAQQILSLDPTMPIILCTGHSDLVDEARARELGIRLYLEKPLRLNVLTRSIRQVMDEARG
jgi:PAS domain S-box-containing protein